MKTSSIGIDAPAEADVGAVVVGEDFLGLVLVDLHRSGGRGLPDQLSVLGEVGVRRIPDANRLDGHGILSKESILDICLVIYCNSFPITQVSQRLAPGNLGAGYLASRMKLDLAKNALPPPVAERM